MRQIMADVMEELNFGKTEVNKFRFCGTEVEQREDFQIKVTCEETSLKLRQMRLSPGRSKQADEFATIDEKETLMSIVGSLMWIARSCRPTVSYRVNALQGIMHECG